MLALNRCADHHAGTFARVWLTRINDPSDSSEDASSRDKVFALKILRKVDGTRRSRCRVSRANALSQ